MKRICEICGGKLEKKADGSGATCPNCGIEFSGEELQKENKGSEVTSRSTGNVVPKQRRVGCLPKLLPLIGLIVLIDGLVYGATPTGVWIFLACVIVTVAIILYWKPWENAGVVTIKKVPPKPSWDDTAEIPKSDFQPQTANQFVMPARVMRAVDGGQYLRGTVQQGCIGRWDTVMLNDNSGKEYTVTWIDSEDGELRAKPGKKVFLYFDRIIPKGMETVTVVGNPNPTESADHYNGTVQEFFANVIRRSCSDVEVRENATLPNVNLPVNFLFCRGGNPVLAVFLLNSWESGMRRTVEKTMANCEKNGIAAMQFFADYRNEAAYVTERIRRVLG